MKVGIIGKGYFGKKLISKLVNEYEIEFITGKEYKVSYKVDWVVIASSTESHYEICKDFLTKGINVFCEKPLTHSVKETKYLFKLADENNCHLYVDDVFRHKQEYQTNKLSLQNSSEINFVWNKLGSFNDSILNTLAYHDMYLLVDLFGIHKMDNLIFKTNLVNKKELQFTYNGKIVLLNYDRLQNKPIRQVNNVNLGTQNNDALKEMLVNVLTLKVDFNKNKVISIKAQELIEEIYNQKIKVAVVGGGIFGITAALHLDKQNYEVHLYEKNSDILQNASGINQYRVHKGYHYPRSLDTAVSCQNSNESFDSMYECTMKNTRNFYCIASKRTLTTPIEYKRFLNRANLKYVETELDLIDDNEVDLTVKVEENLFDSKQLYLNCKKLLKSSDVLLKTNTTFKQTDKPNYDYVVNTTYSGYNNILNEEDKQPFQFELCEKPVIKLPEEYKEVSIVVMDGPFTCIDPLGDTGYHVIGNVVHAIHNTNIGLTPSIPKQYRSLINRGIVKNPATTNINKFMNVANKFFKGVHEAEHIGSMFTVRTVLPRREHDDARPTLVTKHNNNTYSIFSGKITTCVESAKKLIKYIEKS